MTNNSEDNEESSRKKQQEVEAKENEIEEKLDSLSYNDVKESKKEANSIGDDHE
jgi:hypothetical protein